ncbi:squalene synthase HpnC [Novosphingobium sp. Chol11]|uniref:squalene synthase HpnC n=1 Tax=Novosphingobium sp. Chol11 TaxID=1385763 RepID=UPI0025FB7A72|nr:squalene synthase HpnC [Novosphingobium sp. Chol11]
MTTPLAETDARALASGKGHRDENFPVASFVLKPEHRAPVMDFYRFARLADDIADDPTSPPATKLALLAQMRAGIDGTSQANPEATQLAQTMAQRGLDPAHARDLLSAFKRDARGDPTPTWDALMDYCRYSAMPVGRYVLDVHGEARTTWPANDALCAALQIINHLQDCAKDYRAIRRVYLPADMLAAHGSSEQDLDHAAATPGLRAVIHDLALRVQGLLAESKEFSGMIRDARLAMEVAIIHGLAADLAARLVARDPLAERVHHTKFEAAGLALRAGAGQWWNRLRSRAR